MSDANRDKDALGSVAEEAAKLFEALSHNFGAHLAEGDVAGSDHDHHDVGGSAECEWCPVCRAIRAVRDLSPEVASHLAVAASSLMQAATGIMAAVASEPPGRDSSVEHIDVETDAVEDQSD